MGFNFGSGVILLLTTSRLQAKVYFGHERFPAAQAGYCYNVYTMNEQLNSTPVGHLRDYIKLMRLDRRIGIYLVLWPALWTLWISAGGIPPLKILLVFIAGAIVMRSAGCVINDYADRDLDGHVKRTQDRPMATGRVSKTEGLTLFALLGMIALSLVMTLNNLTILLSIAGLALAISYPFMKRFHYLPQLHLGLAFGWAIPMAHTAVTNELPDTNTWMIFIAGILWTTAYDTMYAMVDRDDDLRIGVKSTAILFGDLDKAIIALLQIMFLLCLYLLGQSLKLPVSFTIGLGVAAILLLYQQFLLRLRLPDDCFRAFMNNNLVGLAIFLGLAWPSIAEKLPNMLDLARGLLT